MIESSGNGRAGQDEKADNVDEAEDDDGVVLSKVLISDDRTENWRYCGKA